MIRVYFFVGTKLIGFIKEKDNTRLNNLFLLIKRVFIVYKKEVFLHYKKRSFLVFAC